MKKAIRRLRLRKGDAIIVSNPSMATSIAHAGQSLDLGFEVPIFIVPKGFSLKRVCREYLVKKAQEIVKEFESTLATPKEESNDN
jgi:hypothetical protein